MAIAPERDGTALRLETQAIRELRKALIGRRRPVEAEHARVVRRRTAAPAGSRKEDTVAVLLGSKAHTFDAILSSPLIVAFVEQFDALVLGGQAPAATPIGAGGIAPRIATDVNHIAPVCLAVALGVVTLGTGLAPGVVIAEIRRAGGADIASRPLDAQSEVYPLMAGMHPGAARSWPGMYALAGTSAIPGATHFSTSPALRVLAFVRTARHFLSTTGAWRSQRNRLRHHYLGEQQQDTDTTQRKKVLRFHSIGILGE